MCGLYPRTCSFTAKRQSRQGHNNPTSSDTACCCTLLEAPPFPPQDCEWVSAHSQKNKTPRLESEAHRVQMSWSKSQGSKGQPLKLPSYSQAFTHAFPGQLVETPARLDGGPERRAPAGACFNSTARLAPSREGCLSFLPAILLLGQRLDVPGGFFPFVIPVSTNFTQTSRPGEKEGVIVCPWYRRAVISLTCIPRYGTYWGYRPKDLPSKAFAFTPTCPLFRM